MNQTMRFDWLRGQAGAILPARSYPWCPVMMSFMPYNKYFIDLACSDDWMLASFTLFMDLDV